MLLLLLLLFALAHLSRADEVRIVKEADGGQPQSGPVSGAKAAILRSFFEDSGISPELDDATVGRYEQQVVDKMAQLLSDKENFVASYRLNSQINSLMFKLLVERTKRADSPLKPLDEALLKALELMVPNSLAQPTYQLAKADLGRFCREQIDHCRELLSRMRSQLEAETFHTTDAISYLESVYFNWVPLGRLSKYIEDFGEAN